MTAADPTPNLYLLRARYESRGQSHVFRYFAHLDPERRQGLLSQLERVDLDLLDRLVAEMRADRPIAEIPLDGVMPAEWIALDPGEAGRKRDRDARAVGEELLAKGRVAALVVAGGQGTRLGYDGPKGCFPVGPVSGRSLFAWHASKVLAARRRYGAALPLLVLTSEANDRATREFFAANSNFGLPAGDVLVFQQGMLPAVDFEGRLLLESEARLALAPDGHGGTLTALARNDSRFATSASPSASLLSLLEGRGVEEIFYFQVDNPLVRVLDPVFLGHHRLARAEMSSKACAKRDAAEKVGVFARTRAGDKLGVVEYSDLPRELMTATDASGRLLFRAGNIAIHAVSVAFVRKLTEGGLRLPYHRAVKAIPCADAAGRTVTPAEKNGVKFETFIFDALPRAARTIVLETDRAEEFSPIKNKDGEDSPATALSDLDALFRRWLRAAGTTSAAQKGALEIAPTFAQDASELESRVRAHRPDGPVLDPVASRLLLE